VAGRKLAAWAAKTTDDGMEMEERLSRTCTQPEREKDLWEHEILNGGKGKKQNFVRRATIRASRAPVEAMTSGQAVFVADTAQREFFASDRAGMCAATSAR